MSKIGIVKKAITFHSLDMGERALYVMASLSICKDPRNFYGTNLIETLQENVASASNGIGIVFLLFPN